MLLPSDCEGFFLAKAYQRMNHSFDVEIARAHGVEAAIIIENFRFWIAKNKANGRHFYDGRWWTYNSSKAMAELFPYWSAKQIERIITKLKEAGILLVGHHSQNAYDRTNWYAIEEIHSPELGFPFPEIGKSTRTDINTDINTDKGIEPRKRSLTTFKPPDWINRQHWDAWHTCAKRKKATDAQKQMAVDKLAKWRQAGQDYAGALENAAVGGYQGLFLPDAQNTGKMSFAEQDRTARANEMAKWAPGIATNRLEVIDVIDDEGCRQII